MREGPLGDAAVLLDEGPLGVGQPVSGIDAQLLAVLAAAAIIAATAAKAAFAAIPAALAGRLVRRA